MKITYFGHATFLIEMNGKDILIDPFISGNTLAADIDIDNIPADYILLTHGHQDHVLDALSIANRTNATLISNFEIATWYEKQGVKVMPMNHGGKSDFDFGTLKCVNAVHSSVLPDGTYGGNPMGFVIWNDQDGCIYIAGDTALTLDMKLIPMICPKLDVAILPIGDHFTMGYEDAVLASEFIGCDQIIGCHFDTFGYIKLDHSAASGAFAKAKKNLRILGIGESY